MLEILTGIATLPEILVLDNTFKQKHVDLVAEFKERKADLVRREEALKVEFAFSCVSKQLNTSENISLVPRIESIVAGLTIEGAANSSTIAYLRNSFGDKEATMMVFESAKYLLGASSLKNKIDGGRLLGWVESLKVANPNLRFMELVLILRNGIRGEYGEYYQNIDIKTLTDWLRAFYTIQAEYYEALNNKGKDVRTDNIVDPEEKKMNDYKKQLEAKFKVQQEVYGKHE